VVCGVYSGWASARDTGISLAKIAKNAKEEKRIKNSEEQILF
jgi:hypothetical protein